MSIVVDLIILLIIALTIFLGYKKGLIGVAFSICSFLIAILISFLLYTPVSSYIINHTTIDDNIQNVIVEKLGGKTNEQEYTKEDVASSQVMIDYINDYTNEIKDVGIQSIAYNLTKTIINILSIIAIFVLTKLILFFFRKIADGIANIPIIKQFNKAGGLIYGAVKGVFIIYVILGVVSLISPMITSTGIINVVNESFIGGFMYNDNILLKIIF